MKPTGWKGFIFSLEVYMIAHACAGTVPPHTPKPGYHCPATVINQPLTILALTDWNKIFSCIDVLECRHL
jgi:hypothetical protein